MEPPKRVSPIKDPKRIDIEDPVEVRAWCTLLKLAPEDLKTAVRAVGPMSAAIAVYVNSRGRRGAMRQVGEIGHPFERREEPHEPREEPHEPDDTPPAARSSSGRGGT